MQNGTDGASEPPPLTCRERQILQLVADGNRLDAVCVKTVPETSEQVVKNALLSVRRKLNCVTTAEAVARAFRGGLLR